MVAATLTPRSTKSTVSLLMHSMLRSVRQERRQRPVPRFLPVFDLHRRSRSRKSSQRWLRRPKPSRPSYWLISFERARMRTSMRVVGSVKHSEPTGAEKSSAKIAWLEPATVRAIEKMTATLVNKLHSVRLKPPPKRPCMTNDFSTRRKASRN